MRVQITKGKRAEEQWGGEGSAAAAVTAPGARPRGEGGGGAAPRVPRVLAGLPAATGRPPRRNPAVPAAQEARCQAAFRARQRSGTRGLRGAGPGGPRCPPGARLGHTRPGLLGSLRSTSSPGSCPAAATRAPPAPSPIANSELRGVRGGPRDLAGGAAPAQRPARAAAAEARF
jgi:hypothetical protein